MDRDATWWRELVFARWRDRPGPRYKRLAAALLDAIEERRLVEGTRLPGERHLAHTVGVSRGTIVACYDHLVAADVVRRRRGSGTYVIGLPSWAGRRATTSVATLLLRRVASDRATIDLSVSVPTDLGHLPSIDLELAWRSLDGDGLDPRGLGTLRVEVARHLSEHQKLPTEADQVIITSGAQEALSLLARVFVGRPGPLLSSCPTYPGLTGAFAGGERRHLSVPDADDVDALVRAARAHGGVLYLAPTGHNPTGAVMDASGRRALAALADTGRVALIEDLALADLTLDHDPPAPIAAASELVIAVGTVSKLLWGGLRVGWIRAESATRDALVEEKAALNLATATLDQAVAVQLLARVDTAWLHAHRRALARRRDHLLDAAAALLPAWRPEEPSAGLSLWVDIGAGDSSTFVHVAARHGVAVAAGSNACLDGAHHHFVRLSFAEQFDTLDLAVERLAAAWEIYCQDAAAAPRSRQ